MWAAWDHLEILNRQFQLATLVASHWTGNDRPSHTTCTPKGLLWRDEDIWHVLHHTKIELSMFPFVHMTIADKKLLIWATTTVIKMPTIKWREQARVAKESCCSRTKQVRLINASSILHKGTLAPLLVFDLQGWVPNCKQVHWTTEVNTRWTLPQ